MNKSIVEKLEKNMQQHLSAVEHSEVGSQEAGNAIDDTKKLFSMLEEAEKLELERERIASSERVERMRIENERSLEVDRLDTEKMVARCRLYGDLSKSAAELVTHGIGAVFRDKGLRMLMRLQYDENAANIPTQLLNMWNWYRK